ncbi:hypothetical protein [Streptomyces sp. ZSW22]|uniref:hypothetical protein n=1 Tax=Streptomyces sp. ZSW22 TaxID=3055050 RepID=UPI0025B14550|nr:hypothetical protein [Streptomyces sp. ZSW22]MDN3244166.1 hypothetical protein [Streptomyces sp. ZSW22]
MGNDIEIRVRVANQTGSGLASVNSSLNTLRDRARAATTAMTALRAASRDISVAINLDDRATTGIAAIDRSMAALRTAARTSLEVRLNDRTAAGFTSVSRQIRDLRAQSPIRLAVTFDDQSRQVASSTRALQNLRTAAQGASQAMATLTTRSATASVALHRLAAAADDATGELRQLTAAAGETTTALTALRTVASRVSSALRTLSTRADAATNSLGDLDNAALGVSVTIDGLGDASRGAGDNLRDLRGSLGQIRSAGTQASASLGKSGSGLTGTLIGVGAALGAGILPSIGSLAPMLAGLTVVGGGAALAFEDLKKKAKQLKPAFEDWKKAAERAVAPHTERAVKSLKTAMKELEPTLTLGAETFGTITERAAAFAASPAFQSAFQKNARMGVVFVEQFAESVGKFTQSFFEFGAKSQPALDAMSELLGGLLDEGLPGMFDGLEQGISGSSKVIAGLADFLNEGLLPALGKIAGSFSEAFGPLIGAMLETAAEHMLRLGTAFEGAMEGMEPLALIAADAWRAFSDVLSIGAEAAWSLASNLGGALFDSLMSIMGIDTSSVSDMAGGFTKLSDWVDSNREGIRGFFYDISGAMLAMVATGISALPKLFGAFRLMSEGILTALDGLISGLAIMWGDLPGMGWLKDANRAFDEFAAGARSDLDDVGGSINGLVDETMPRLNRAKLKMNVDEAKANLADIKAELDDPHLTKTREAKLKADKKDAEAALREATRELSAFDKKQATGKVKGDATSFFSVMGAVNRMKIPTKTGNVKANTSWFSRAISMINGRVVGNAYINVYSRQVDSGMAKPFRSAGGPVQRRADGGALQHFPNGGLVEGPGGPRSDSIFATFPSGASAMVSDTEYVVQSSAVKKYGLPVLDALNRGTLKLAGGGVTKKEQEARNSTRHLLSVSRFGQMAGWRHSEIRNSLGDPGDVSSLVTALSDWRSNIQKTTHGRTESNLLRQLDATGRKLFTYQKNLDKASSSLQKSKDRLDDLRRAASQLRESVMNNVLSSASITKNRGDGPVTVSSIISGLTASRDQASAFEKALDALRKKGLSGALIEQIGEAGIDGGGLKTAGALMRASSSEIKHLNSLQSQITRSAAAAGKTTADAVYASQIKGQEALVKAWEKTVSSLKGSMDRLAHAMERSIEKAWWPGKASGGIVGAASGGARGSWTMVGEHEPELVKLPFGSRVYSGPDTRRMQQQAWTSMLTQPRAGGPRYQPTSAAGSQTGRPIEVVVQLGGTRVGSVIVDLVREEIRNGGSNGNVQAYLGRNR